MPQPLVATLYAPLIGCFNSSKVTFALLLHFLPQLAILPAKEQQRLSLPHHHVLDLRDKDRMVPRHFRRAEFALEIRQRPVENRSSVPRPFKPRPGLGLRMLVVALGPRVVLRDRLLILAEDIDPES